MPIFRPYCTGHFAPVFCNNFKLPKNEAKKKKDFGANVRQCLFLDFEAREKHRSFGAWEPNGKTVAGASYVPSKVKDNHNMRGSTKAFKYGLRADRLALW